jgi:hypothetical protein
VLRLEVCFVLLIASFKQDSPGFLGTLRAVPDKNGVDEARKRFGQQKGVDGVKIEQMKRGRDSGSGKE